MILVKVHEDKRYTETRVISLCDENLIGKKFEEGELQLDVSERFYKGEKFDENRILEIARNATNLNVVGEESVNLLIKNKLISKKNIRRVNGIPHAQVYSR